MEYDVILGMDWLSTHHAHVDCHQKRITFKMEGIPEFTFEGVKDEIKMQIILAIKATKLLRQGCWGFLASVIDKKEAELKIESIAVVRDYPNVFSEKLRFTSIPRDRIFY